MKKLIFLTAMLLFAVVATEKVSAQNVTIKTDTSVMVINDDGFSIMEIESEPDNNYRFNVAGYEINISDQSESSRHHHRKGYNSNHITMELPTIGFSNLVNKDYSGAYENAGDFLDLNLGKSIEINWGVVGVYFGFGRHFGLSTGLSLVWNNYTFSEPITLVKEGGMLQPSDIVGDGFAKSKLTTFALRIPLEMNVNITRNIRLGVGVFGQANLNSYTKTKYPVDKHYNMYITPFSYGVTASICFEWFSVYADYSLTPLFQQGKGPGANVLSIGIGFGF
jgi:hypothetical protein